MLTQIYSAILKSHFPDKKYEINAVFYDSKSLRHTIELRANIIYVRIAGQFISAPERILYVLGIILLNKLFRHKLSSEWRKEYNRYMDRHILPHHTPRTLKSSSKYTPVGRFFDLEKIFAEINVRYFNNSLVKPVLGWSLNRSYTRLGFYSEEKNLLVISRIFDSKKVPDAVVYFMMFHEMLHIHIPVSSKNGRRIIHPPEFKKQEHAFPDFDGIQKWIKKYRHRL